MTFDPHPNLQDAIDAFEARMAVRDFEREPLHVVTAAALPTRTWRASERRAGSLHRAGSIDARCAALAETGEHLGIERVGLVVESREVTP
jgi:hypothetical protein